MVSAQLLWCTSMTPAKEPGLDIVVVCRVAQKSLSTRYKQAECPDWAAMVLCCPDFRKINPYNIWICQKKQNRWAGSLKFVLVHKDRCLYPKLQPKVCKSLWNKKQPVQPEHVVVKLPSRLHLCLTALQFLILQPTHSHLTITPFSPLYPPPSSFWW